MARVIVVLGLMIAITAAMFWITRKPPVAEGVAAVAATQPSATVTLADLKAPTTPGADQDIVDKPEETHSPTTAEPRAVTNGLVTPEPTTPNSAQDVTSGPVAGAAPSIGTAGIDHKNNASFTGTATPGDAVSLVWDNKPISWTTADTSGNWTLEFKAPVSRKEHELYVTSQSKDGTVVVGPQRAFIGEASVPGGMPNITLRAADKSTKTLQDGTVVAAGPATGIVVEKIVSSDDGQTNFSGKADAGATLKIEINGKAAGETVVADDGDWSLAVANPTAKAAERVHLELVGKDGAALDKAVVPYKMAAPEVKVAAVEPPKDVEPAKEYPAVLTSKPDATKEDVTALFKTPEQASSEKPKRRIIRVRRGDSLWRISRRHLGNGKKWAKFYRLNKRKIDNPDLIYPGQTLILPG